MDIPPPVIITIQLYYIALRGISKIHAIYIGYKECLYGRKPRLVQNFCRGGRCKSFSGAAKELYISQPAVSLAIMNLEKELGSRLFIRSPRGVTLTYEGQLLYEYIESAINLVNMGETKLTELHNLEFGELRIGVGDTISKYFLLPHLVQFHKMYPNINLRVINRTTPDLCTLVKSGEIDCHVTCP